MTDIGKLGEQLRELREAQGLSYDDVSKSTRVRPHLLRAIEEGRIEEVAAPVYARGFVKTYCEYLLADDLWRKYNGCLFLPDTDVVSPSRKAESDSQVEINHSTPVFRRSSIIWVYVVLVIAVLGAAFLLWNQQRDGGNGRGFPLRVQEPRQGTSQDASASDDAGARAPKGSQGPVSSDAVSADSAVQPKPSPVSIDGASRDNSASHVTRVSSGDLSWMDEAESGALIAGRSADGRGIPVDRKLFIKITGRQNRLVVRQGGENLTRRTLSAGDVRSYDVAVETEVSFSVGSAADVTWFGKNYNGIGSEKNPISMVFYPDGGVRVITGISPYFKADRAVM
jgi:cytoskeletal protein RodZ